MAVVNNMPVYETIEELVSAISPDISGTALTAEYGNQSAHDGVLVDPVYLCEDPQFEIARDAEAPEGYCVGRWDDRAPFLFASSIIGIPVFGRYVLDATTGAYVSDGIVYLTHEAAERGEGA